MEELVLILRALESGQGVSLDGLPNEDMRNRMGKLLTSCQGVEVVVEGEMMEANYYYRGGGGDGGGSSKQGLLLQVLNTIDKVIGPRVEKGQ